MPCSESLGTLCAQQQQGRGEVIGNSHDQGGELEIAGGPVVKMPRSRTDIRDDDRANFREGPDFRLQWDSEGRGRERACGWGVQSPNGGRPIARTLAHTCRDFSNRAYSMPAVLDRGLGSQCGRSVT